MQGYVSVLVALEEHQVKQAVTNSATQNQPREY